jgi:pimeloyl-ACP methyl ester carboxylesterase
VNFPLRGACDTPGLPRLPDRYREAIRSDVPALLISGSLDARTPPANAAAVAVTLPRARTLVIDGASHDLFRRPETMKAIIAFLRQ